MKFRFPIVIIDDVAAVMRLSDRFATAEALHEALAGSGGDGGDDPAVVVALPPPSLCLSARELEKALSVQNSSSSSSSSSPAFSAALLKAGLSFPVIVKPRAACGVPEAHRLAVAFDERGLEEALRAVAFGGGGEHEREKNDADEREARSSRVAASSGALIQQYIDHGGVVFKVYAAAGTTAAATAAASAGETAAAAAAVRVFIERRASTPDLLTSLDNKTSWLSFDSAAPLKSSSVPWPVSETATATTATAAAEKGEEKAHQSSLPFPSLDPRVARATAARLLSGLGRLSLLGFDVVVERGTGRCFVVDVNYFPSMRGEGVPRGVLAEAVAAQVGVARER